MSEKLTDADNSTFFLQSIFTKHIFVGVVIFWGYFFLLVIILIFLCLTVEVPGGAGTDNNTPHRQALQSNKQWAMN